MSNRIPRTEFDLDFYFTDIMVSTGYANDFHPLDGGVITPDIQAIILSTGEDIAVIFHELQRQNELEDGMMEIYNSILNNPRGCYGVPLLLFRNFTTGKFIDYHWPQWLNDKGEQWWANLSSATIHQWGYDVEGE